MLPFSKYENLWFAKRLYNMENLISAFVLIQYEFIIITIGSILRIYCIMLKRAFKRMLKIGFIIVQHAFYTLRFISVALFVNERKKYCLRTSKCLLNLGEEFHMVFD
jgi:hypothetical protein